MNVKQKLVLSAILVAGIQAVVMGVMFYFSGQESRSNAEMLQAKQVEADLVALTLQEREFLLSRDPAAATAFTTQSDQASRLLAEMARDHGARSRPTYWALPASSRSTAASSRPCAPSRRR